MLTGFLRVLASGVLFLLLATTTTVVRLADGASSSWDDVAIAACEDEILACVADETCVGCFHPRVTESEELDACRVAFGVNDTESSTASCDDYTADACCIDQISEHDCSANDAFEAWFLCWMAAVGCSGDNLACASGGATTVGIVYPFAVLLPCTIVMLLLFLWP